MTKKRKAKCKKTRIEQLYRLDQQALLQQIEAADLLADIHNIQRQIFVALNDERERLDKALPKFKDIIGLFTDERKKDGKNT